MQKEGMDRRQRGGKGGVGGMEGGGDGCLQWCKRGLSGRKLSVRYQDIKRERKKEGRQWMGRTRGQF